MQPAHQKSLEARKVFFVTLEIIESWSSSCIRCQVLAVNEAHKGYRQPCLLSDIQFDKDVIAHKDKGKS